MLDRAHSAPQAVCGIVDRGWVEVDEDVLLQARSRGLFYSLCAGRPVEVEEQIGLARRPIHSTRAHETTLFVDAAQEALVGEDLLWVRGGDDGLKVDGQPVLAHYLHEPLAPDDGG